MINDLIAVTGANGFIGEFISSDLISRGFNVRKIVRSSLSADKDVVQVGEISPDTDWFNSLRNVSIIFHCAAIAHVLTEPKGEMLSQAYAVNVEGACNLARQAILSGVKRFIFISSAKVSHYLEMQDVYLRKNIGHIFQPDPYTSSKLEAENQLQKICSGTDMELVIIRPPLVYGPRVRGNFFRLVRMIESGLPLPLGFVSNKRSYISIDNLSDFLIFCAHNPDVANNTFSVSDNHDLSTLEFIKEIHSVLIEKSLENKIFPRRRLMILPIPFCILRAFAVIFRLEGDLNRFTESMVVDMGPVINNLKWRPPITVHEGLRRALKHHV